MLHVQHALAASLHFIMCINVAQLSMQGCADVSARKHDVDGAPCCLLVAAKGVLIARCKQRGGHSTPVVT